MPLTRVPGGLHGRLRQFRPGFRFRGTRFLPHGLEPIGGGSGAQRHSGERAGPKESRYAIAASRMASDCAG
jgi:hypothetical protein